MYQDNSLHDPDNPFQKTALAPMQSGFLTRDFLAADEKICLKRLTKHDIDSYLQMHTHTRLQLPEDKQHFMKKLERGTLALLIEKDMPVVGLFASGRIVSGCAVFYPADKQVASLLPDYDFNGLEDKTAVMSAVWTHPDHMSRGYSKKVLELALDFSVMDGKEIFRATVNKQNEASLTLFRKFTFDTAVEGRNAQKFYPALTL